MIDAFTIPQVYASPTMHDKPQAAPSHEFQLPGQRVLAIQGRDAAAFAQAQFMNDVATLAIGHWQWNGWLTPKGRVIALFALLKIDAETLWLLLPDAEPAALAEQLRRFVFRSKLSLNVRDDLHARGEFAAPERACGSTFAHESDCIELDLSANGGPRRLRISTTPCTPDTAGAACWDAADLAHGLPRLPASQAQQWTPQQLSLERLRAFSVKKGCYPGQEIVARTHFLGQAKRGLQLFETIPTPAPSSEIRVGERLLGSVVCSAGNLTLAVLPQEALTDPPCINGIPLHPRPLQDGLAR